MLSPLRLWYSTYSGCPGKKTLTYPWSTPIEDIKENEADFKADFQFLLEHPVGTSLLSHLKAFSPPSSLTSSSF